MHNEVIPRDWHATTIFENFLTQDRYSPASWWPWFMHSLSVSWIYVRINQPYFSVWKNYFQRDKENLVQQLFIGLSFMGWKKCEYWINQYPRSIELDGGIFRGAERLALNHLRSSTWHEYHPKYVRFSCLVYPPRHCYYLSLEYVIEFYGFQRVPASVHCDKAGLNYTRLSFVLFNFRG